MKHAFIGGDLCELVDGNAVGEPIRRWERVPSLSADQAKEFEVLELIEADPDIELQQVYENDGWAQAVKMYIERNGGEYPEGKEAVFVIARENGWTFKRP